MLDNDANAVSVLVSVLVVNYNGRRYLEPCLRSLENQALPRHQFEIILVDNGSSDGSAALVRTHFAGVRVLELSANQGFAGGNLAGLQQARGRYVALLNNDATADPNWLTSMVAEMERGPAIGGVAAKVVFAHDPGTINSAGIVLYRDGRGGDRGFRCKDHARFQVPTEVFGACGAAVMYRRQMLDDVGFFEQRYFMYYEDLDLAWRAQRRGWRFVYAPTAVVHHVHCGSGGEWSPRFSFFVERNRALTSIRNGSPILAVQACVGLILRTVRCWWRLATRRPQWQRAHGWAYLRAVASLLVELPAALSARQRLAATEQVPAHTYAHLIEPAPKRAT